MIVLRSTRVTVFVQNFLLFHVCRFDEYRVVCSLHHGSQQIGEDVVSHTTGSQKDLCDWLNWDQWSVDMNDVFFKQEALCQIYRLSSPFI